MYLGLDLGTSSLKGIIVDDSGEIIAQDSRSLALNRPAVGWSEQDPNDWIAATAEVLTSLQCHLPRVRGIGLSGQMHGATCLDNEGRVIRDAILWNDTRATKQAHQLDSQANLKAIFGNITFPGFTSPKLLWLRDNEPQHFERIDKVLLPKDYLRYWLTCEYVSEMSDASGTGWLDIGARDWSDSLLAASSLQRKHMPRLVEGNDVSACLRAEMCERFGFNNNTIVAGGAGDNAASAVGLNISKPSQGFISVGTSGVVFTVNDRFKVDTESAIHSFCHAIPKTWHQMGVTLSATDCLNWLATQFNQSAASLTKELQATSAKAVPPSEEIFLPFLGGERTPFNNAQLRAKFAGLSYQTDKSALTRAVLEGVCFSLKQCFELMVNRHSPLDRLVDIKVVGGGAQSDVWMQILANVINAPLDRPKAAEHAAAIGAARLAAMALGVEVPGLSCGEVFEPNHLAEDYQGKYQGYVELTSQG